MIQEVMKLLFYFSPAWIAALWYSIPRLRKLYSLTILAAMCALSLLEVVFLFGGGGINEVFYVLGIYSSIWVLLFWAVVAIMIARKYGWGYSSFVGLLVAVVATEIWEIPIHFITVKTTPTAEQLLLTAALSTPYLVLLVPLVREAKTHGWKMPALTIFYLPLIIGFSAAMPVAANSYPSSGVQHALRIMWALFFGMFPFGYPKRSVPA